MALDAEDLFYDVDEDLVNEAPGASVSGIKLDVHRAAFDNDVDRLAELLRKLGAEHAAQPDPHGNNPLHVAALRGNPQAVQVLLDAGLSPTARNSRGWTPLDEALAARALPAARLLQRKLLADIKTEMKAKREQLVDSMRAMPDYSLELKWQLGSSVPGLGLLLRRYAPHDTYTIWKVGDKLRVDGSLMGIDTKSIMPEWKRGHFSLIVDGSAAGRAAAAEAAAAAIAQASLAAETKEAARTERQEALRQQQFDNQHQQQQHHKQQDGQQDQQQNGTLPIALAAAGSDNGLDAATSAISNHQPTTAIAQVHQQPQVLSNTLSSSSTTCIPSGIGINHDNGSTSDSTKQQHEQFYDAEEVSTSSTPGVSSRSSSSNRHIATSAVAASSGPRLLFLNHGKGTWLDLSADKKALKLEGRGEQEELDNELAAAMERDVDKLRLKPRNFKFAPVKGWMGGAMTEKVEGWRCTVYEATGKLLAVNTAKAHLHLPSNATFENYLAAQYEADEVTQTLIDPLSPSGMSAVSGKSKSADSSNSRNAAPNSGSHIHKHRRKHLNGQHSTASNEENEQSADDQLLREQMQQGWATNKHGSRRVSSAKKAGHGTAPDTDTTGSSSSSNSGGRVLRARCWMAQDFPMSLGQLLPLLDVIGAANKHMAKVGKFLAKYSQLDLFPVKVQVPLLLTVYVLVSFKAFQPLAHGTAHPPPPEEFFSVPEQYVRRHLAEVMDKASANIMSSMGGGPDGDESAFMYGSDTGEDLLADIPELRHGSANSSWEYA